MLFFHQCFCRALCKCLSFFLHLTDKELWHLMRSFYLNSVLEQHVHLPRLTSNEKLHLIRVFIYIFRVAKTCAFTSSDQRGFS